MATAAQPLLQAHNLSIGYPRRGGSRVLATELNFALAPGQLVFLLGPNGVGKSTLLRTLVGLAKPLAGHVSLAGQNAAKMLPAARARQLALMLPNLPQLQSITPRRLVALGRAPYTTWLDRLSTEDKQAVNNALAQAGVAQLADRQLYRLSDGERRLVLLARALAQATPLLLLDEPTAHLDVANRLRIFALLKQLAHEQGKAVLVSTHELPLALQHADALWLLYKDGTFNMGAPEELGLAGAFTKLYAHPVDALAIHPGSQLPLPQITGPEPARSWLQHALARWGVSLPEGAQLVVNSASGLAGTYIAAGTSRPFDDLVALRALL